ncbi:MAG: hypothetical protein RRY36_05250 [Bacteroidaceae bacterium]
MEQQKQVKLIGLRVKNNGIIQAATLTPDVLNRRLVVITGETGNGKSTLLNAAKIATCGTAFVKKKDALPIGFEDEALLLDGDVKIYVGLKVSEYQMGEKTGEPKVETYLYTKDNNGRAVQPIIDGVAWSASEYWGAITTELTHSLSDLFSENQTVHRKLIEKLFKPELQRMGVEEVAERILKAKKERDNARTFCQAHGAFMERFEDEGYNENSLSVIKRIDIQDIGKKLTQAIIERDRMLNSPDAEYRLACNKIEQDRAEKLRKIKEEGDAIRANINIAKQTIETEYNEKIIEYNENILSRDTIESNYATLRDNVMKFLDCKEVHYIHNEQGDIITSTGNDIIIALDKHYQSLILKFKDIQPPVKGLVAEELIDQINKKGIEYNTLNDTPLEYPSKEDIDTTDIDKRINLLESEKEVANSVNKIYDRYQLWLKWIEAKGMYEKEIDTLRRLYASINTGIPGITIVPQDTDSGRVEVWIKYNGEYDIDYFSNKEKESRFMFDYSSFQRTIIGLMLQSARLNTKPKALRLAYVDDVAFTSRDLDILGSVAEELDLMLIIAWTQETDKDKLFEGQILVEGGETFFNGK